MAFRLDPSLFIYTSQKRYFTTIPFQLNQRKNPQPKTDVLKVEKIIKKKPSKHFESSIIMDQNKDSPRNSVYQRRRTYIPNFNPNFRSRHPDFFSKKRMICDCKLEFLDAGAYEKHMKNKHPDKNPQ